MRFSAKLFTYYIYKEVYETGYTTNHHNFQRIAKSCPNGYTLAILHGQEETLPNLCNLHSNIFGRIGPIHNSHAVVLGKLEKSVGCCIAYLRTNKPESSASILKSLPLEMDVLGSYSIS